MINRILIRIKVVQMLYSYLLTRNDFKMPALPDNASRDKVFGFNLYHDLLLLMLNMAGLGCCISKSGYNVSLHEIRFLKSLANDPVARNMMHESGGDYEAIRAMSDELQAVFTKTHVYRNYVRLKNRDLSDELNLMLQLIATVKESKSFFEKVRHFDGFTNAGYELAFDLLAETVSSYSDNRTGLTEARHSLGRSLDKAYELYHALLQLIVDITDMQDAYLDAQKHKHLATAADLNPNMKFVENRTAALLRASRQMQDYLKETPINWVSENPGLVRRLLDSIIESDIYAEYMESEESSLEQDCEFWRNIFRKIIFPSDDLAEALESMSVYWNDDINIMDSFVLKTIKRMSNEGEVNLLPKYKDEEDARFGIQLFDSAISHRDEYQSLIDRFIDKKQWETDRLAFMDIVIMLCAITELLDYPAIPVPVTMNEYIEIANSYSTSKSGQFINGLLSSIIKHLKEDGRLNKN